MFAASGHRGGGSALSGVVAAVSVLAAGGGSAVAGVVAALSVLAAGGGSAVSGVGAALSVLAAGGGVDRERDPRTARGVVALRGARLGFAAPALCVPAAEAFVLRRVVARARDVASLFSPLEPDAGVAAGSRRSISSATARSSETAARAARWACLPALSLTPLSAFAACLRRPTRRSRSKRSASFLAMILLLALPRLRGRKPYRGVEAAQRRSQRTRHPACPRSSSPARTDSASYASEVHLGSEVNFAAPTRPAASWTFAPLVLSPTRDASAAAASDGCLGVPPVPPGDDCLGATRGSRRSVRADTGAGDRYQGDGDHAGFGGVCRAATVGAQATARTVGTDEFLGAWLSMS
jgi:hypothetical protein